MGCPSVDGNAAGKNSGTVTRKESLGREVQEPPAREAGDAAGKRSGGEKTEPPCATTVI